MKMVSTRTEELSEVIGFFDLACEELDNAQKLVDVLNTVVPHDDLAQCQRSLFSTSVSSTKDLLNSEIEVTYTFLDKLELRDLDKNTKKQMIFKRKKELDNVINVLKLEDYKLVSYQNLTTAMDLVSPIDNSAQILRSVLSILIDSISCTLNETSALVHDHLSKLVMALD